MSDSNSSAEHGSTRRILRVLTLLAVVGCFGVLVTWGFVEGRSEAAREAERERPVKSPLRVSLDERGDPVVTLDAETQTRSGIKVTAPQSVRYQDKIRAYGTVLDLDKLSTL
ncbi:MAG: multidrug transporter, partial [Methylocella sp.]